MPKTFKTYFSPVESFLLLVLFLLVCMIIIKTPLLWGYYGIIPVTILYIIGFLIVSKSNHIFRDHICIPSVLFLSFLGYFIYLGTIDHYVQTLKGAEFLHSESLTSCYIYVGAALLSWIAGYKIGQIRSKKISLQKNPARNFLLNCNVIWNQKRLYSIALFWGGIGIVSFIVFYFYYIGGIPILQGTSPNASPELRDIVMGRAHNVSVIAFNATTMAIIFSGVYIVNYQKNKGIIILILTTSIILFSFWGARIYIVLPFLVFLLLFIRKRKYSLKITFAALVMITIVASIYGIVRNYAFFSSHGIDYSDRTTVERLSDLHISPEFRAALGVISNLDELRASYGPKEYFMGIYLTAVPKKILALFDIDKNVLFSEEGIGSDWLAAKVTRGFSWGGVRSGILGQTLMALGMEGVVAVFLIYGLLFSQLDKLSKRYFIDSPRLVLVYILTVIFSFSIIGTTHSVFSKFWYFLYGYLITAFLAAGKSRRSISSKFL